MNFNPNGLSIHPTANGMAEIQLHQQLAFGTEVTITMNLPNGDINVPLLDLQATVLERAAQLLSERAASFRAAK